MSKSQTPNPQPFKTWASHIPDLLHFRGLMTCGLGDLKRAHDLWART